MADEEHCPDCGGYVDPLHCPKCGIWPFYDHCYACGFEPRGRRYLYHACDRQSLARRDAAIAKHDSELNEWYEHCFKTQPPNAIQRDLDGHADKLVPESELKPTRTRKLKLVPIWNCGIRYHDHRNYEVARRCLLKQRKNLVNQLKREVEG